MVENIRVDDLDLKLVRSRRKTLTLEIGAEGLKARAPLRMRLSGIAQFVRQKRSWIDKQLQDRPAPLPRLTMRSGDNLLFQGQEYELTVLADQRGKARFEQQQLLLPVSRSHLAIEESTRSKLIKFYKAQALATIEAQVSLFAKDMAVSSDKLKGVKVRDYKRRWGSCDHLGRLSFNWRIIQAPAEVLDYVVVHELAHCHEFNHSKRFWKLVERQLPDRPQRQAWLHTNGALLYRF